jgi:hypothetical protein
MCQFKYHHDGEKIGLRCKIAALGGLKILSQAGCLCYNTTQKNKGCLYI